MSDSPRRSAKTKTTDKPQAKVAKTDGAHLFLGSKVIGELRILLRLASPQSRRLSSYPGHFQPAADL